MTETVFRLKVQNLKSKCWNASVTTPYIGKVAFLDIFKSAR